CNDHARRRSRLPQPAEAVDAASPDAVAIVDDRLAIAGAMRKLPLEQRTAVIMRDLLGLSYDEIAQATGSAVGTVKSRISRGRAALVGCLGEPGPDPGREPGADRARLSRQKP